MGMELGDVVEIPLTQGQVAIIDAEDWELVKGYNWRAVYSKKTRSYYADTVIYWDGKQQGILMHRLIMNAPNEMMVDHRNHNTLDNRKCNLRLCTHAQNKCNTLKYATNTSGYKGVSRNGNKWQANIKVHQVRHYLGTFDTPEIAHAAYCAAALTLHGEFAHFGEIDAPKHEHQPDMRSHSEIMWSSRRQINNQSGKKGVCKWRNRWMAKIQGSAKVFCNPLIF